MAIGYELSAKRCTLMKPKIGIFAGSFDPVHDGHLRIGYQALEAAGLEKVFFLPEPRPRRKQGVKALEHRLAMVQLAIAHEPHFGSIVLEQQRFTINDTLPLLQARFKDAVLYLLMGDDVVARLAEWPHLADLGEHTHLLVAARKHTVAEVKKRLTAIQKIKNLNFSYQVYRSSLPEVSSSRVRAELRTGRQPVDLPPAVYDYVRQAGLYKSAETSV